METMWLHKILEDHQQKVVAVADHPDHAMTVQVAGTIAMVLNTIVNGMHKKVTVRSMEMVIPTLERLPIKLAVPVEEDQDLKELVN